MPRHVIRSKTRTPKHDKFVKKLVEELKNSGNNMQPLILEEERTPIARYVTVIWDQWRGIDEEERAAIIDDAYERVEGKEFASQIMLAQGVTPGEAVALGLLPYKVVPVRKSDGAVAPEVLNAAIKREAANTLLGSGARELRFARLEDAEAAKRNLEKILPKTIWSVVQQVADFDD